MHDGYRLSRSGRPDIHHRVFTWRRDHTRSHSRECWETLKSHPDRDLIYDTDSHREAQQEEWKARVEAYEAKRALRNYEQRTCSLGLRPAPRTTSRARQRCSRRRGTITRSCSSNSSSSGDPDGGDEGGDPAAPSPSTPSTHFT